MMWPLSKRAFVSIGGFSNTHSRLACNNDWLLEEGWALYFVCPSCLCHASGKGELMSPQQGCHFVRCGVEGLGSELRRRGISRQSQWGARGIV